MYDGIMADLIDELGRLPGIGPKSAQRLAFHEDGRDAQLAGADRRDIAAGAGTDDQDIDMLDGRLLMDAQRWLPEVDG